MVFLPPKRFAQQYHIESEFTKKWCMPSLNSEVSYLNKTFTYPVNEVLVFRDASGKSLKVLFKVSTAIKEAALQPAITAVGVHQKPKVEGKLVKNLTKLKSTPTHILRCRGEIVDNSCRVWAMKS